MPDTRTVIIQFDPEVLKQLQKTTKVIEESCKALRESSDILNGIMDHSIDVLKNDPDYKLQKNELFPEEAIFRSRSIEQICKMLYRNVSYKLKDEIIDGLNK